MTKEEDDNGWGNYWDLDLDMEVLDETQEPEERKHVRQMHNHVNYLYTLDEEEEEQEEDEEEEQQEEQEENNALVPFKPYVRVFYSLIQAILSLIH